MQESNLDVNLIIQTFQEKVSQLMTELVVKEATVKQLSLQIQQLQNPSAKDDFETPEESTKKVK
jgi:hypothetical protein